VEGEKMSPFLKSELMKLFAVTVLCCFTVTFAPWHLANAEDNAPLKRGGFQLSVSAVLQYSTVYVTTRLDGSGEIAPSDIVLNLRGKIDFRWRNGHVERAGLFAGHCKRTDCGPVHKLLWFRSQLENASSDDGGLPDNDWTFDHEVETNAERLLLPTEQIGLIQQCSQAGVDSFYIDKTVTLSVNTRTEERDPFIGYEPDFTDFNSVSFNGGDQSRHADFQLQVVCQHLSEISQPEPKTPDNLDLEFDHGPMKVNDIKLTFTTFQNGYTEPNPGTRCKKARLRVRLETNQKGFVSFKLWQQRADEAVTSKEYIIGSHHDGNGRFFATKDLEVRVYKTTMVQANAKELISETFQKETGWKKIRLVCRGSGGTGGLVNPADTSDDTTPDVSILQGGFQLIDNSAAAKSNTCRRTAKALIWFNAPSSKNIHYSLDCGALGNFSGTLKPNKIDSGKYRAGKLVNFAINGTIQAGCTLRTVAPGQPKDHAFESETFTCHTPVGHGRGDGLTVPVDPVDDRGRRKIGLDPKIPNIKCSGGELASDRCNCPTNMKRTRIRASVFRCVGKPAVKTAPVRTSRDTSDARREAEAKRKRDAEAKRKAEARRKAAAKRKAEARRKAAAKRKAEARRKAAAKRKAEARGKAAAKRKAEARRKAAAKRRKASRRACPSGKVRIRGRCRKPAQ